MQSSFTIMGTNPANGSVVSSLPSGQIAITFSQPIAGLVNGGPALSAADPYGIYLLARGPDQVFSAPSGIDSGDLPLHVNTYYTVNPNGTSTITLTPLEPLSSDVYLVHVNLGAFTDTSGEPLYDPNNGYTTFLLRLPPATSAPLAVTGVTTNGGATVVANNLIAQPDTLAIHFNKPLFAGTAAGNNVQLLAAPNYTPVPSVATYNPTNDTIYLTPTALLTPGTTYIIAVSGAVSDDQGLGVPGQALGTPYYDSFQVSNPPTSTSTSPLMVADNAQGNLATLPANGTLTTQPLGYAAVGFTEALNLSPSTFGRYSAMLDPRTVGTDGNTALENVPLNAQVAFNPNTNQLIIVPTQMTSNGLYVLALANIQAANGDPLETPTGQQAGVNGPPVFATFDVQASDAAPAVVAASGSGGASTPAPAPARAAVILPSSRARRPAQTIDVPGGVVRLHHHG